MNGVFKLRHVRVPAHVAAGVFLSKSHKFQAEKRSNETTI